MFARGDQDLTQLVHHSDRGVQYLSIRYTERLGEAGVVNSIGSRGDSYDNALAESFNGLYKTEYVDWFNHQRLHTEIGKIPPAELETTYYRQATKEPQPL